MDCLCHWGTVSQNPQFHPSLYEKMQKAKLEIEFAFREYPGLLDLAKFLKYERVANSDPIATLTVFKNLSASELTNLFGKDCSLLVPTKSADYLKLKIQLLRIFRDKCRAISHHTRSM